MLNMLGRRQQELLTLLLNSGGGLTVDELASQLAITRNAVRLHLSGMEKDQLVVPGATRPTGGRPEQLYVLTDRGRELFPRQYFWFAQLMVEAIRREAGSEALRERLRGLGTAVADGLRSRAAGESEPAQRVARLSGLMGELGYRTRLTAGNTPIIEADNCVFHQLAMTSPEVCEFDLALLARFTDSEVEHQECIAKGGQHCRFKFTPK